jgi:hypothetical protein
MIFFYRNTWLCTLGLSFWPDSKEGWFCVRSKWVVRQTAGQVNERLSFNRFLKQKLIGRHLEFFEVYFLITSNIGNFAITKCVFFYFATIYIHMRAFNLKKNGGGFQKGWKTSFFTKTPDFVIIMRSMFLFLTCI